VIDGASGATSELTPRGKRILFARLLVDLVQWGNKQRGWEIVLEEGYVKTPRRIRDEVLGYGVYPDAVHRLASSHYFGIGQDLLLYRDGSDVTDQQDIAWQDLAEHWEKMHQLCVSGIRRVDFRGGIRSDRLCTAGIRHVSLGEASKLDPLPWKQ
jgi:hypothetical protein